MVKSVLLVRAYMTGPSTLELPRLHPTGAIIVVPCRRTFLFSSSRSTIVEAAGSCAFAHGIGELRHPTLDDQA